MNLTVILSYFFIMFHKCRKHIKQILIKKNLPKQECPNRKKQTKKYPKSFAFSFRINKIKIFSKNA